MWFGTIQLPLKSPSVSLRASNVTVPDNDNHDRPALAALEAALQTAESRWRAILDAGYDAQVIARAVRDQQGVIVDFVVVDSNRLAAHLVDETQDSLVGRSLLEAFPLSAGTALFEQCCEVVSTQKPLEMAQSAPVPGSRERWVQRQLLPLGEEVAISSRDVTARERARRALELSEARHREVFETSAAIQLIVDDTRGVVLAANPAAELFYGWPRESMQSMLITDLDDTPLDTWRERLPVGAARHVPAVLHTHRVKGGKPREVEIAASHVQFDGRPAYHLIVHDVSDRLRAEAQLRESEARFRAVINAMSEGVVIHDATGAIRGFNPSAERILGLSAVELRGLQPAGYDWQAVHEDGTEWPTTQHPALEALRSGRSQPRTLMGLKRTPNAQRWLQVGADPLIRPGESIPYAAVAVFADVTAQRGAEERARHARKLEVVGQLAGGIAHDFNNLLTVIRGAAGFLIDALDPSSPLREDVDSIERATMRAEELTRRLLAVGRRQILQVDTVDLRRLVQEQFPAIREDTPPGIQVVLALDAEPVLATLDRTQVEDAVRELVDNAREAMPDGGTLTIGVREVVDRRPMSHGQDEDASRFAVLEVRDTGSGMDEAVRSRMFEPFFSTQPFGSGRGMGLAAVHGMVAQSHGFIECDTEVGVGTSVRLHFPVAKGPRVTSAPHGVSPIAASGVLLVDDDPMLRELISRMLERLGHRVAVATSGADALDELTEESSEISMMVTDLVMPGMDGMALINESLVRRPHLPVVAISGFSLHAEVRDQLLARGVAFLGKPFRVAELASALDRAVRGAQER